MPGSKNRVEESWDYLEKRFGIERSALGKYKLVERSGDIWIVSEETSTELEVETSGIRFIRFTDRALKPTTYALQLLGDRIEKNVLEVNEDELKMLLDRDGMVDAEFEEDGYVALKFDGRIVGCGFYKEEVVSSRIPKGRSEQLLQSFR